MADITITAANVTATSSASRGSGVSGAAITAGQSVYADPADNFRIKPASAASANPTHAPNVVGVALNSTPGPNQPVNYATDGDVNYGSGLTTGILYVVSAAAAGGIAPSADIVATNFVVPLGVAISASTLRLKPVPTSAQR